MIKVLTIGNSFADNATRYLEEIAVAGMDVGLVIGKANLGGCSLEKHWNLVEQCDLLHDVKPYDFYMTGAGTHSATLKEALTSEKWDFVTLQQVSDLSFRAETFYPYIEKLFDLVGKLAPQAQRVIHQTWAYRSDSGELKRYGISQEEMFTSLKQAYSDASEKLGCRIIPCGEAFQKARAIFNFTPDENYDFENPKPLELPDQSKALITGYFWRTGNTDTGKAELLMDGRHGNEKGCYLANAIWYEMFTKNSIFDNKFCPEGVSQEDMEILKNVAHETVIEYGGSF
jgi:hypothetical protein